MILFYSMIILVQLNIFNQEKLSQLAIDCSYEIDLFDCLNINCNGIKEITKIPPSYTNLINFTLTNSILVCSLDFTDTGITRLTNQTLNDLIHFYSQLSSLNKKHSNNLIKIFFSNIDRIEEFNLPRTNFALFISDSSLISAQANSLRHLTNSGLNFFNFSADVYSWANLLNSTRLDLLELRNIQNLPSLFVKKLHEPRDSSITDLKIYYSSLPLLNDNFLFFKLNKQIRQLEIVYCNLTVLKENLFMKNFKNLKYLILSNNNLSRISTRTFRGLDNVQMIDLDENPIEYIETDSFASLVNLKTLSINKNVKIVELMRRPEWLGHLLESHLKNVFIKSDLWFREFCLVESIYEIFQYLNDSNRKTNLKQVVLFNQEQMSQLDLYDSRVYCNFEWFCQSFNQILIKKVEFVEFGLCQHFNQLQTTNRICIRQKLKQLCPSPTLYSKFIFVYGFYREDLKEFIYI